MAVTGLLALLDDITAIMDDVAVLSKVAAKKTAGIAGDDLAVNAEGLVGIRPSRELPIVGKVALGSTVNKTILVPVALLLPHAAITPLLMIGGTYLCYEGFHKVAHRHDEEDDAHHLEMVRAIKESPKALALVESKKVKQAIITDFVLSAEIVAVALGAVADEPMATKATVLIVVAAAMTVAIYGLVAVLVKIDDVGLLLQERAEPGTGQHKLGGLVVAGVPHLMKFISVVGTIAMFLVGGGIMAHGIPGFEDGLYHLLGGISSSGLVQGLLANLANLLLGLAVGAVATLVVGVIAKVVEAVRGSDD